MAIMEIQKTTELPVAGVPSDGLYFVPVGDIGGEQVTESIRPLKNDANRTTFNYMGISISYSYLSGKETITLVDASYDDKGGAVVSRPFTGLANGFKYTCTTNVAVPVIA